MTTIEIKCVGILSIDIIIVKNYDNSVIVEWNLLNALLKLKRLGMEFRISMSLLDVSPNAGERIKKTQNRQWLTCSREL